MTEGAQDWSGSFVGMSWIFSHAGNLRTLEGDLVTAGQILGGLALGWLALRTRSFWYGAFIHGAVDVTHDLMVTWLKHHPS